MKFNPFFMNQEGSSGRRSLFCLFLLSVMVLMAWSPSLASKVVVIGQDDNCPAGTQCDPAGLSGGNQTKKHTGEQGNAATGSNIFGQYLEGSFKDAESGKSEPTGGGSRTEEEGAAVQATEDGDEGKKDDDIFLLAGTVGGVPGYYAYTFGNAGGTSGNAILLGDSAMGAYVKGYEGGLRGFAPKEHGASETGRSGVGGMVGSGAMRGTRPAYAPLVANFSFDSNDPAPARNRADFLAKDQESNLPAAAGKFDPITAESNADFGNSPYTSVNVAGGEPKYKAGQSRGGSYPVQSLSLSLGPEAEKGSFTVRDFFGFKEEQKDSSNSTVTFILVGVGVLQASILGVIVIRILIERAR